MARTSLYRAEIAFVFTVFPFRMPASTGPLLLVIGLAISSPLAPLFLAWSLPGATRTGLPSRSIGALCLLIVYQPFRYYWEGLFFSPENLVHGINGPSVGQIQSRPTHDG